MPRLLVRLCTIALCAACSEPPQKEIDRAQGAIDAARAAGADQYAAAEISAATTSLQQAHEAVDQRDYRLALSRAVDAGEHAQEAAKQAADGKARARSEAESAIHSATTAIQQLQTKLKAAPTLRLAESDLKPARQALSDGERAVQKARAALAKGGYLDAKAAVQGTAEKITEQIRDIDEISRKRATRPRK